MRRGMLAWHRCRASFCVAASPPTATPSWLPSRQVPYKVLRFLFTEINYGGRVTDDKDRRLINALVEGFCGPKVTAVGSAGVSYQRCTAHR